MQQLVTVQIQCLAPEYQIGMGGTRQGLLNYFHKLASHKNTKPEIVRINDDREATKKYQLDFEKFDISI